MTQLISGPLVILLIEDNPDHVELVEAAMSQTPTPSKIYNVSDGEAALDYLFRRNKYADPEKSPRPHVILLDLRIPKIDGLEVLKIIKETDELKTIPVVVLTTSSVDKDVFQAYCNYVNSYLVKPMDSTKFIQMMKDLQFYWLKWNVCPKNKEC